MANAIIIDGVLYEQKTPEGPFEPVKYTHSMEDAFRFKPVQKAEGVNEYWLSFTCATLDKWMIDEHISSPNPREKPSQPLYVP